MALFASEEERIVEWQEAGRQGRNRAGFYQYCQTSDHYFRGMHDAGSDEYMETNADKRTKKV